MYETTKFVLSLLLDSNAQLLFRSGNTEECTFLYIFNDYNLWSHQLLSSIRIVSTYISIDTSFLMKHLNGVQNILSRHWNNDIKYPKLATPNPYVFFCRMNVYISKKILCIRNVSCKIGIDIYLYTLFYTWFLQGKIYFYDNLIKLNFTKVLGITQMI